MKLVARQTIEEIAAKRDEALSLYSVAYEALEAADKAVKSASDAARSAAPLNSNGRYTYHLHETMAKFDRAIDLPDRDFWFATAKRIVDTACWQQVIQMGELDVLMDKQAKDELHAQFMEVKPTRDPWNRRKVATQEQLSNGVQEFTVDTVYATIETYRQNAGLIFHRGVANAFSKLDRRFRSHDGFKIGSRLIFTRVFNEFGGFNHYRDEQSTILDVERVFLVLDGKPLAARYGSILQDLERARGSSSSPRRAEVESDYFKLKSYMNGNVHMWFKRDDLVEKVNKLLNDYYNAPLNDWQTPAPENPMEDKKTALAKNFAFFPTPESVKKTLFEMIHISQAPDGGNFQRILEPSAGTGSLAKFAKTPGTRVDCCEVQMDMAYSLAGSGLFEKVYNQDFLALSPATTGVYDAVIMNPPFDRERDIDHVMHAWDFVAPGGYLAAIMSAGTCFRETKKSAAFRAFVEKNSDKYGRPFHDLPAGSFSSVGTNVNTVIVKIYKPKGEKV